MQVTAGYYIRRVVSLPPHVVARKTAGFVVRRVRARYRRWHDLNRPTYGTAPSPTVPLASFTPAVPMLADAEWRASVEGVAAQILAHRFDVLGSGWVHVRPGMQCAGVEGVRFAADAARADPGERLATEVNGANRATARAAWQLIDAGYEPIDWQRDIKSGYRWSARAWAGMIRYGVVRGADVKVPWELARLQHLGQLAVAHAIARADADALHCAREFRNEILDFVATNPPRYGVNWTSAMDVAIRAANMVFAHDLFRRHGAEFDAEFECVLQRSVADHARFVLQFLEWNDELRGNHYLANLAGLLFAAAYLPSTPETDGWLAFALRALLGETVLQFNAEGSNFEGSTAYHRLSGEMVVYAAALMARIPDERVARIGRGEFTPARITGPDTHTPPTVRTLRDGRVTVLPGWMPALLERIARFSAASVKPDGGIVLFGDNDSGRFIKLHPRFVRRTGVEARTRYGNLAGVQLALHGDEYWDEDHQDPSQLIGAIAGLTGAPLAARFAGGELERRLFESWASDAIAAARDDAVPVPEPIARRAPAATQRVDLGHARSRVVVAEQGEHSGSLRDGLELEAFPAFGLYVARSRRLYLAVRCGPVGQNGHGGHDHNDQLACELVIDGESRISDPGTYLYSPFPDIRNAYRAAGAHFTPWPLAEEPARLTDSLFRLGDARPGICVAWNGGRFIGEHAARGIITRRAIVVLDDRVVIDDSATVPLSEIPTAPVASAPGYGVVRAAVEAL